jgi:DNA-binding transcriptional MocR family regulator
LAHDLGLLVIEDQAYADLNYEPTLSPPALWSSAADPDLVITLYTFAKCLAPGIRVGWLVSGERLVAELTAEPVRHSGGGANHFAAMVVAAACMGGHLDRHIGALREQLRMRRDTLLDGIAWRLPDGFIVDKPPGGFFAWVRLPGTVGDEDLLREAEARGVSFAAGRRFGTAIRGVRLCFAAHGPVALTLGATRFLAACRAVHS